MEKHLSKLKLKLVTKHKNLKSNILFNFIQTNSLCQCGTLVKPYFAEICCTFTDVTALFCSGPTLPKELAESSGNKFAI